MKKGTKGKIKWNLKTVYLMLFVVTFYLFLFQHAQIFANIEFGARWTIG